MALPELVTVLPVANELGEGVIWDSRRSVLWWTDILNRRLYRYHPESSQLSEWVTPHRLCCFATVASQDYLIAAFDIGFAFYKPESGQLDWIHKIEENLAHTRLNDGRADRQGRFWAGSMVEGGSEAGLGSLYCLDHSLNVQKHISGLSISNGLCWSPDSRYLYHTDTPSGKIDRYDFDCQTAELSQPSTFASTQPGCSPDGSTIDSEGYLWNAQWGGSQVVRYNPEGRVDLVLPIPVSQPTCVSFGGADLNLLFVTTARQGLDEKTLSNQPQAGNLFVFATDVRGLPDPEFCPNS